MFDNINKVVEWKTPEKNNQYLANEKLYAASKAGCKVKCSSALGRPWTRYKLDSKTSWAPRHPKKSWIQDAFKCCLRQLNGEDRSMIFSDSNSNQY